jgi:hypothetical protein
MKWTSLEDGLPDFGQEVLIAHKGKSFKKSIFFRITRLLEKTEGADGIKLTWSGVDNDNVITHWMIPETPINS